MLEFHYGQFLLILCVSKNLVIKNNSRNHILPSSEFFYFAICFSFCSFCLFRTSLNYFFNYILCCAYLLKSLLGEYHKREIYLNTLNWYIYGPLPRVSVWGIGYIFNALSSSLKWCFNLQLQLVSSLKLRQRSEYLYRFFSGYMCVQIPKNMVEIFEAF